MTVASGAGDAGVSFFSESPTPGSPINGSPGAADSPGKNGHESGNGQAVAGLQGCASMQEGVLPPIGQGVGAQASRSCLGAAGIAVLDSCSRLLLYPDTPSGGHPMRGLRSISNRGSNRPDDKQEQEDFVLERPNGPNSTVSLKDGPDIPGMVVGLMLGNDSAVTQAELDAVREHRWVFNGAIDLGRRGRSFYFFTRCLLDLQRNVQLELTLDTKDGHCMMTGEALETKLTRGCTLFVSSQCREGRMGEMYQVLTSFICNSLLFDEWKRYLDGALQLPNSNQESVLVPHVEQVWYRFCRFKEVVEEIFDVLNQRFIWRHRLPKVGELVRVHMKRRCFSSTDWARNELIVQEKCTDVTIKAIKREFFNQE